MRFVMLVTVLFFIPAFSLAQSTTVDIKCNGLEQGAAIPSGGNVKLTFDVTAGSGIGNTVDIWIVLKTPFGFFCYDSIGAFWGWNFGYSNAYFTGPLIDFQDVALDSPLPDGPYNCHIALDTWANGIIDFHCLYTTDSVAFRVGSPEMAYIPAGAFQMGDHHDGTPNALPVHAVYIDSFWIDVYEVTNQVYCNFLNSAWGQGLIEVRAGVVCKYGDTESYCETDLSSQYCRIHWDGSTFSVTPLKEDHPMVEVSWYGAAAYANWRSEKEHLTPCYDLDTWDCSFTAGGYRLPTEAEWEKAARGGENSPYYRYPWGDTINGSKANYEQSGDPFEKGTWPFTSPVGYYDGNQIPVGVDMANGYGLYDMAGNAREWCNDWWDSTYYSLSPYKNPRGPGTGTHRAIRGGSWGHSPDSHCCGYRYSISPEHMRNLRGFRLVL